MAGESAQQRYERLRANRKAVDRRVLPWVLGTALLLAIASYVAIERYVPGLGWVGPLFILTLVIPFLGPSRTEANWRRGAVGERIVGRALDALEPQGLRSLHDRRMPRSRANLDHISVADGRVYTVDAKRYSGAIAVVPVTCGCARLVVCVGRSRRTERQESGRPPLSCSRSSTGPSRPSSARRSRLR